MSQSRDEIAEQVVALAGSIGNEKAERMRELVAEARRKGAQASGAPAKWRVEVVHGRARLIVDASGDSGEQSFWINDADTDDEPGHAEFHARMLRIAIGRIVGAPAPASAQGDESAWLIERPGPLWWSGREGCGAWTTATDALRFARWEDADRMRRVMGFDDAKATEHIWCAPPSSEKTGPLPSGTTVVPSTESHAGVGLEPHAPGSSPAGVPSRLEGDTTTGPDVGGQQPASPVKPCPFCGGPARLVSHESPEATNYGYEVHCDKCGAMGPSADCEWDGNSEHAKRDAIEAWNRRTPAPSPATGESAIDKALDPNCWDLAMQADTLAAARAELASLRAEVDRQQEEIRNLRDALRNALRADDEKAAELRALRTALAENEDSVRDVAEDVLSWLDECKLDGEDGQLRERLRTALGAKETK